MIPCNNRHKRIALIVILLHLISCSGPVRKSISPDRFNLTPERAKNINWSKHKIRLIALNGYETAGYLRGWNETGFFIERKSKIDTLNYDNLRPYLLLHSGKSNSVKGMTLGLVAGAGLALANALLVAGGYNGDSHAYPVNPEPLVDDAGEIPPINYLAISTLLIIGVAGAMGSAIGSFSDHSDKYYYAKADFALSSYSVQKRIDINPIDGNLE